MNFTTTTIIIRHHSRHLVQQSRLRYIRPTPSFDCFTTLSKRFISNTRIVLQEKSSQLSTTDYCPVCQEPSSKYAYELPEDLPIDTTSKLSGNVVRHAINFMISTGRNDWTKTIEEEQTSLAEKMKALIGRGGKFNDPYNNIITNNTSFPIQPLQSNSTDYNIIPFTPKPFSPSTWTPSKSTSQASNLDDIVYTSAIVAPLGLYIPYIPLHSQHLLENLVRGFLLPKNHEDANLRRTPPQGELFKQEVANIFKIRPEDTVRDISSEIRVLVCGHEVRDKRCGIIGPVVADALTDALNKQGFTTSDDVLQKKDASVGLISHIGGHKFAGNVIIYLPAHHPLSEQVNQMQGKKNVDKKGISVWYGRVRPEHAEGIVQETIQNGVLVKELLRGMVDIDGEVVTLPE